MYLRPPWQPADAPVYPEIHPGDKDERVCGMQKQAQTRPGSSDPPGHIVFPVPKGFPNRVPIRRGKWLVVAFRYLPVAVRVLVAGQNFEEEMETPEAYSPIVLTRR